MYTTIRHEIRHARKAWPGTLVDPCLVSLKTVTVSIGIFYEFQEPGRGFLPLGVYYVCVIVYTTMQL